MFDHPDDASVVPVVLGIDPGVSCLGYGAVRRETTGFVATAYGVIRTSRAAPLPERLGLLAVELESLMREVAPEAIAVERVLFQVNTRTAMSVGQASGLALSIAGRAGIPVTDYSPNEVKLAVAGHGGAKKGEVQQMVTRILGLPAPPRPPDAADALALALCHWWRAPMRRAVEAAVPEPAAGGSRLDAAIGAALAREAAR